MLSKLSEKKGRRDYSNPHPHTADWADYASMETSIIAIRILSGSSWEHDVFEKTLVP